MRIGAIPASPLALTLRTAPFAAIHSGRAIESPGIRNTGSR
jgi:hypothetical protein